MGPVSGETFFRTLFSWLFQVSCEEEFTTEAQSSQSSENFLIKNSLLRALRASAVQFPSPAPHESPKNLFLFGELFDAEIVYRFADGFPARSGADVFRFHPVSQVKSDWLNLRFFRVYCEDVFTTKCAMSLRPSTEHENGGISLHIVLSLIRHSRPVELVPVLHGGNPGNGQRPSYR